MNDIMKLLYGFVLTFIAANAGAQSLLTSDGWTFFPKGIQFLPGSVIVVNAKPDTQHQSVELVVPYAHIQDKIEEDSICMLYYKAMASAVVSFKAGSNGSPFYYNQASDPGFVMKDIASLSFKIDSGAVFSIGDSLRVRNIIAHLPQTELQALRGIIAALQPGDKLMMVSEVLQAYKSDCSVSFKNTYSKHDMNGLQSYLQSKVKAETNGSGLEYGSCYYNLSFTAYKYVALDVEQIKNIVTSLYDVYTMHDTVLLKNIDTAIVKLPVLTTPVNMNLEVVAKMIFEPVVHCSNLDLSLQAFFNGHLLPDHIISVTRCYRFEKVFYGASMTTEAKKPFTGYYKFESLHSMANNIMDAMPLRILPRSKFRFIEVHSK